MDVWDCSLGFMDAQMIAEVDRAAGSCSRRRAAAVHRTKAADAAGLALQIEAEMVQTGANGFLL
jgi:hypothetical protein